MTADELSILRAALHAFAYEIDDQALRRDLGPRDYLDEAALRFRVEQFRAKAYDPKTLQRIERPDVVLDWEELQRNGWVTVEPRKRMLRIFGGVAAYWRIRLTPRGRELWTLTEGGLHLAGA